MAYLDVINQDKKYQDRIPIIVHKHPVYASLFHISHEKQ